jgi:hypothetical protein
MVDVVTNGHAKGRVVPPLPEHTFQGSGITVRFRRIGPMAQQRLAQQIMLDDPEPVPPMVKTELGEEPNPADPAHDRALKAWQARTFVKLNQQLLVLAALECEVTIGDAEKEEIARRQRYLKAVGMPWEPNADLDDRENERVFYILYIACAESDDLSEFGQVVMKRSLPTEAAVAQHIETFPGDVPGA